MVQKSREISLTTCTNEIAIATVYPYGLAFLVILFIHSQALWSGSRVSDVFLFLILLKPRLNLILPFWWFLKPLVFSSRAFVSGADPGAAGKGRGTNRPSCSDGWREPDSLVQCCIFEVANSHLLLVSHCCFCHFGLFQMVVKSLNGTECLIQQQHDNYF